METFLGDTEESPEDSSGRKKSKLKLIKSRLFGKSKKGQTSRKLSQSASDITDAEALGSNEDLVCNPAAMGSRAFSHDSIFLADHALTEAEPTRVLSQENVHFKIKALQEKLQQQKFNLGPPPQITPSKHSEDQTVRSEEDVHNESEMTERPITTQDHLNKVLSQMSSNPMLLTTKPVPTKPSPKTSPIEETPLDFSSPAQFTSSLDTSAARHRLSVKPRNQRASSKKRVSTVDSTALTFDPNDSETLKEENEQPVVQEEPTSEIVNTKVNETTSVESEPTKPEPSPKPSSIVSPQKDISILGKMPTVSAQILRPKANRPADVIPRPHSSCIVSEAKGTPYSSGNFDIQFLRDTQNKTWATNMKSKTMSSDQPAVSTGIALRPTVELDRTSAIKRPLPGSGSFHLSASNRKEEEERPRSGSFTGVREHAWIKTGGKKMDPSPNVSPKVDLKPGGVPLRMGREETWMIKDSLRKVETVKPSRNKLTDTGDHSDTAKEAEEEEAKTTFGVKLRSTSQSVRLRPETASNECLKLAVTEEKQHKQDTSNNTDLLSTKATTAETKYDVSTAPSAPSVPTKQTAPAPVNTPLVCAEAQPSQAKGFPQAPQGPQPQASSTEVSWMSMAMEKTRNLQNLFTSKFPKDLTGGQTAVCSHKIQVQTSNLAQTDTQRLDAKSTNQPLSNVSATEAVEHKPPAQTVKPLLPTTTAQQNSSASPFIESQISKPTVSQPVSTEAVTHSVAQGNIWTSQSPLRSVRQVESTSQGSPSSPHSTSQPPLWSTRSLRSTGLTVTQDTTANTKTSTAPLEETEGQSVWGASVSKKAAFLEKRAEWTSSPVEIKSETLVTKEAKAETRHTVSNPKRIPERPKEEKWIRKTADPSPAPSSSPTLSSTLQSMSDSGELSWIELAKRKSMAWSDKTMDL
ncbi:hypothetical protein NQD34_015398 [Periophthalmus magnuspinnatus]|nr:hypothetical protein NQD34_015398 [Periophthalmus magnuspinnatus]